MPYAWRLTQYNPAALVPAPRPARHPVPVISPDAAGQVLAAVRSHRLEALVSVALAVGLRQGEALGLKWEDVDFEAGQLRVRHSLRRVSKQGLQLTETETPRSRRMVALPASIVGALRSHKARQSEERLLAGESWTETGFVFTSEIGTAMDGTNATKRFQRLLFSAGLPRLRFHDLRHGCASLLLAQGVHPRVVMETLGHSQISLTMNTYSHVIPALQREAADRMEQLLGSMTPGAG
jgi:integrase